MTGDAGYSDDVARSNLASKIDQEEELAEAASEETFKPEAKPFGYVFRKLGPLFGLLVIANLVCLFARGAADSKSDNFLWVASAVVVIAALTVGATLATRD